MREGINERKRKRTKKNKKFKDDIRSLDGLKTKIQSTQKLEESISIEDLGKN